MGCKALPEDVRFWRHVDIKGHDECWPWLGYRIPKSGYGTVTFRGKTTTAHRAAYILATEEDIGDDLIMHECDNPPCANPSHLRRGSQKDNIRDMHSKGRAGDYRNFGENNGRCIVTDVEIEQIRALYGTIDETGYWGLVRVGALFGVTATTVCGILKGRIRRYRTEEAPRRGKLRSKARLISE
jgi:hypothetical protein